MPIDPDLLRRAQARARALQGLATLEQWAADAAQVNTDWPTMTAAQKDTALRETIRRLGLFFDRFADILIADGRR